MAAKNWSDEQVALVERLEELLFREDVSNVVVPGNEPVSASSAGKPVSLEPALIMPEAMLRDLVNELLLPYAERKAPPKASKSGNPAKRAAENKALGIGDEQPVRVKGTTTVHEAALLLPHSTDKGRSLRLRLHSIWPPVAETPVLTFAKLTRVA